MVKIIHSWGLVLPSQKHQQKPFWILMGQCLIGTAVVCVSTFSMSRARLLNERIWTWHARHISTCSTWCIARASFAVPQCVSSHHFYHFLKAGISAPMQPKLLLPSKNFFFTCQPPSIFSPAQPELPATLAQQEAKHGGEATDLPAVADG